MLRKLPIVGVFGAGTPIEPERARLAREIGAKIAGLGVHLLTGAGFGVMAAAAEGFVAVEDRAGWSIGIVPRDPAGPFDRPNRDRQGHVYPNAFVEIAIHTPLPPRTEAWRTTPARNHVNVLTADAVVALPGGVGTRNELDMLAAYRVADNTPVAERQVILLGPKGEFAPAQLAMFAHGATAEDAKRHLEHVLARLPAR